MLRFVWVSGQSCLSVHIQTLHQPWAEVNELFLFSFVLACSFFSFGLCKNADWSKNYVDYIM